MKSHWWRGLIVLLAVFSVNAVLPRWAAAQGNPEPLSFKFNSGQDAYRIFEGWQRKPDGSYEMWFGYINRNYVETLAVPVGPENKFDPAPVDRGQPAILDPRIHRKIFHVNVPKDWGKKELVWTLVVRGSTQKAVGWLQPEWEIDPIYQGRVNRSEESKKNTAPVLSGFEARATANVSTPLTLAASVKDDGLPKPRPPGQRRAAVGQETPPTLKPLPDQAEVPVNVPTVGNRGRQGGGGAQGPQGLAVTWSAWRGPAAVTFAPATVQVKDGKAETTATFTKPGTYLLHVVANDGELNDLKEITVTVNGTSQQ